MSCSIHPEREQAGICTDCGRSLCSECVNKFQPPTCPSCIKIWGSKLTKEAAIKIALSIVVFVLIILTLSQTDIISRIFLAYIFASIPWGWAALSKFTSNTFLFLSFLGWAIYFILKGTLSFFIGWAVLPFQVFKLVKNLKLVKQSQLALNE